MISLFPKPPILKRTTADTPEPPRIAAVLRKAQSEGVFGQLDRTLFYGAAASAKAFEPSIISDVQGASRLVLQARGSETVVASNNLIKAAQVGTITLVKYFRDGSALAASSPIPKPPSP